MKINRKILALLIIVVSLVFINTTIFAAVKDIVYPGGTPSDNIQSSANYFFGTYEVVSKILAFTAMLIAGLRYMFSSADAKADIKKQTAILVVGAALVFASGNIITFFTNVVKTTLKSNNVNYVMTEKAKKFEYDFGGEIHVK